LKVSVALASCNGERYIGEQLQSILAQTRPPDQLVLRDDCSDDRTVEIAREFSNRARIPIDLEVNSKRLGYTRNFSTALQACDGDVVFLSDQDDIWQPEKIETVLQMLAEQPAVHVLLHDAEIADESGQGTGLTKLGQIRDAGMSENAFFMGSCMAVHASFLDAVLPIPDEYAEHDHWLAEIARSLGMLYVLEKPLQRYRRHGGNQSLHPANRTVPLGRLGWLQHRIRRSLGHDFVDRLQQQVRNSKALLSWSRTNEARSLARAAPEKLSAMQADLDQRLEALNNRLERLQLPRHRRWRPIAKAWRRGEYHQHSGITSAVRDFLK
jgi:glycosyltransferase involved in cell wall biosynthesis